jgi:chromosome segregation ATPase
MKNCQYVLDVETPFIRKLYDKEDNYKVELLTPYGILEELKKLQEENADLEAKLAESEKNVQVEEMLKNYGKEEIKKLHKRINEIVERDKNIVTELKQQLAEKEKEIEKLTEELDDKNFCKDFVDLYSENKLKTQMLQENWKDKISFAVERLEKVKEWCENHKYSDEDDYVITYEPDEEDASGCMDYLKEYIDNQIEELKKEMK